MLAPPTLRVVPELPAIERILPLLAYEGYTVDADAVLYGMCNHALWGDDDLHAAVLLVHHGPKRRTRLMAAARAGDVPRLTRLLRTASGALRGRTNVNGADSRFWTALHTAAECGQTAALGALLAAGAAVGAASNLGFTPLHTAAQFGQTAALEALLAAGAAVGTADSWGWTALHRAAQEGHTAALEALLAAGAAVDARSHGGSTPLHLARDQGHAAVIALLAAGVA